MAFKAFNTLKNFCVILATEARVPFFQTFEKWFHVFKNSRTCIKRTTQKNARKRNSFEKLCAFGVFFLHAYL